MNKFNDFLKETDDYTQHPVTADDIDQPKNYYQMKNWLDAHGIYYTDISKDHVKKCFRMESDSEYDIAADKLKFLLNKK